MVGDHSNGGAIIGGALKQAGFEGIIRYAAGGRGDVNITPAEVADLKAHGLGIGIVCEHEADWMLRGGVSDRVAASRDIARACGLPDGVIYQACDFDVTLGGATSPGSEGDRNMVRVGAALTLAAGVIGEANVGFYGSVFAINWLVANVPWLQWYWQTEAWSAGQKSSRACLFQRASSMSVGGVDIDIDDVWSRPWGQRGVRPTPPDPSTFELEEGTMTATELPILVPNSDGRLESFRVRNQQVQHKWQITPGGAWSDWTNMYGSSPQPFVGVSVGRNKDGRLELVGTKADGTGHMHTWQVAPSGGWVGHWEVF